MANHVYRLTEVVGTSGEGLEAAIGSAIDRADRSLRGMDWFEVSQIRGHIVGGVVAHYQVGIKIGFRLDA